MSSGTRSETADVLIAGSGLGGLVASVRALQFDADVLLVEKAPRVGGTTLVSGGVLTESGHDASDVPPQIDPFEPVEDGITWLEDLGVTIEEWSEERSAAIRADEGDDLLRQFDPPALVETMADRIEDQGGRIELNCPIEELRTDDDGRIAGAIATDLATDERVEIEAGAVILATGGYSGNSELVETYYPETRDADVWLRRDPWTTGDGFLAAKAVGAKVTGGLSIPYGRSLVAPPAVVTVDDLREASQYYGARCVAIRKDGLRFTDESTGRRELNEALIDHSDGQAFLVLDQALYESNWPMDPVGARIERSKEFGGLVVEAASLEELGRELSEHDVDGARAVETITAFNESVRTGQHEELDPPRRRYHDPVDEPPFYAVKTQAGVSFYFGGLDVDENAQVLSRARSCTSELIYPDSPRDVFFEPIDGLYAAGVEVGRPDETGFYQHGLALGLATGRIAGEHAARSVQEQ